MLNRLFVILGFLFALGLRLWGIGFGLPYLYHPDEPTHVLQALALARGLPDGVTFLNPPLYKYLLLAEYALTYGMGRIIGYFTSPQDFINQFRTDPTPLYALSRAASALFGAMTVFAVYALASRVANRRAGLVAVWFTAVAYSLVRESHFAVNDTLVTLVAALALYASIRVLQQGERRDYLFAGTLVALAFVAKYQGAAALVPLLLAHFLRPQRRTRDVLAALGAVVVVVLVTFPFLVFDTRRVLADMYYNLFLGQTGYNGLDPAGGYVYYFKVMGGGLGWLLFALALVGLVLAILRRDPALLVVASLPLTLYAVMGYERMYFVRFILPALPALIVLASTALDFLVTRFVNAKWQWACITVACVLLGAPTLLDTVRFDWLLTQTDTRTIAHTWMDSTIPREAYLATDWFPLAPAVSSKRQNVLVANGWSLFDLSLDEYRERSIEYLVVSSYNSNAPLLDPVRDARRQAFYTDLAGSADMVVEFRPYTGSVEPPFTYDQIYAPFDHLGLVERPGPTIRIYRLR